MENKHLVAAAAVGGAVGAAALYQLLHNRVPKGVPKYSIRTNDDTYGGLVFAECFKNHGVRFVFTLTGGHIAPILVGSSEMGIRVIDVRHEVNAVFAADAVSRLTGVPGVAVVTAGPGLTNTITAVKNAQMAQSPLVLIGGATSDLLKGRGSLQDIEQEPLLRPHVKSYRHIYAVKDIVPAVEEAFRIAQEGVPGPVMIEVPLDVLYKPGLTREWANQSKMRGNSWTATVYNWYIDRHYNNVFSCIGQELWFHAPAKQLFAVASDSQVRRAAALLARAKRPLVMVSSQAMLRVDKIQSGSLAGALVKLGYPTILTGAARGLLGQHSELQIRQKASRKKAMKEADVVLVCGAPMDFRLGYGANIGARATLISVNLDYGDLTKNRSPTLALQADPGTFVVQLGRLSAAAGEGERAAAAAEQAQWLAELRRLDAEEDAKFDKDASQELASGKLNPMAVCRAIEKVAGPNAIFIVDGGDFVATASYVLRPRAPLTWMDPGVFGTLGVGGGFAAGAKAVSPDAEVWIVYGDGALGYSLPEFDTFVRHKLPVIAVVGNDACWAQIHRDQAKYLKSDVGCMLAFTNYQDSVRGLGAEGILLQNTADIERALTEARELARRGRPVLVNALIGRTDFREGSLSM